MPLRVPAKIFVPLMANEKISGSVRPLLIAVHELPLLFDKNIPFNQVDANIFVPLTANDEIGISPKPLFTADHEFPLLVDKNTPASVPAKVFVPLITIELTYELMMTVCFYQLITEVLGQRLIPT